MNGLTGFWMGLDTRRRAFLIGSVVALLAVLVILSRLATAPSYTLLYSGLDATASGQVIQALDARGAIYTVRGDAIFVEQAMRDQLRMALAADGLPANGAAGYELLDSLSGFGTTSQMFDAAFWRAKEGELARTIVSSPHIRAARVLIANPGQDPFQPAQMVTASVALQPASGAISASHAQALRYLVSSSVPGLLAENVTVIDADSGHVLGGDSLMSPGADANDRAETLRQNIARLLAARVGPGNAVVEVTVELTTARETILERLIDPQSRVVISTDTEEREDSARDNNAGGVTVASNLPDAGDVEGDSSSTSTATESRERVTFDMSETQREVEHVPGGVRRISVAVLLNGVTEVGADGVATIVPRRDEEIAALETLVRSAIGFDLERGDQVSIQSMAFEALPANDLIEPTAGAGLDLNRLLQIALLSAVALAITFGLLRPMLRSANFIAPPEDNFPRAPVTAPLLEAPATRANDPTVSTVGRAPPRALAAANTIHELPSPESGLDPIAAPPPMVAAPASDPVARLRRLIEEREEETVEILRSWMDEDEEVSR